MKYNFEKEGSSEFLRRDKVFQVPNLKLYFHAEPADPPVSSLAVFMAAAKTGFVYFL